MRKTIIDDFLEESYFRQLQEVICGPEFPWYYTANVVYGGDTKKDGSYAFFLTHMMYDYNKPMSEYFDMCVPLCQKIEEIDGTKSLIRIRANFFPHTNTMYEHPMHVDKDFDCYAAILSLNTCDGYTKLGETDEKIASVENRALFMDAGKMHCSSTTTNEKVRFNMTVTYL